VDKETTMPQHGQDYPLDYNKTTGERAKDRLQDMADSTADQLKTAAERAQDIAGKATEQAREYGEKAQEAVKQFKPAVEKSLKEQPMATLAIASVIGFVLGALWKK
jgi:ElaB/YqjD/DUF883 family membrane-anchored ribosome-binding protein